MTLAEYYAQLLKKQKEERKLAEESVRFDKLPHETNLEECNSKMMYLLQTSIDKIDKANKEALASKLIGENKELKKGVDKYFIKLFIHKIDGVKPPQFEDYIRQIDKGLQLGPKEFKEIDNLIKKFPEYEQLKNVSLLDAYILEQRDKCHELVEELDQILPEEDKNEIITEDEKYVHPLNRTEEQLSYRPLENKANEILENKQLTPEQKSAIEYVKENIKLAKEDFNSSMTSHMMAKQGYVERENDNNVLLYKGDKIDEDKLLEDGIDGQKRFKDQEELKKFREMDFDYSKETREAMLNIMNKIDSFDLIDSMNILAPEEGSKEYAFRKVRRSFLKIKDAMEKEDLEIMPHIVEEYKANYQEMNELLDYAKENLNNNGKTYGCNVDVARSAEMPIKFRKEEQASSLISSLMIASKYCKFTGISFEEFVNSPRKALTKGTDIMIKRCGPKSLFNGTIGESLSKFDTQNSDEMMQFAGMQGTVMRAFDALHGMEKDPEKLNYNSYVRSITMLEGNRVIAAGTQNAMIFADNEKETFRNIFLSKPEDVDILRMCACELVDYDYEKMQPIDKIDMVEYTKKTKYDAHEFLGNVEAIITDYLKSSVLVTKQFHTMIEGAKQACEVFLRDKELSQNDKESIETYKNSLSDKKILKIKAKECLDKSIKVNEKKLFDLTGMKCSEKEIEVLKGYMDDNILAQPEQAYMKFKDTVFKKMYVASLVKNNFDPKKVKYGEIENALDELVRAKAFGGRNNEAIDSGTSARQNISSIKYLSPSSVATWSQSFDKTLPKTVQDTVDTIIAIKADESKDRIHGRHEYAVNTMNEIWTENVSDKESKEYKTALDTSCAILNNLEAKANSRGSVWKFFHYFGQYKEEKNTIIELKNTIMQKAGIDAEGLTTARGSKSLTERVVEDITHKSICQNYEKTIYPFGKNDENLTKAKLSPQQQLNMQLNKEVEMEKTKEAEMIAPVRQETEKKKEVVIEAKE